MRWKSNLRFSLDGLSHEVWHFHVGLSYMTLAYTVGQLHGTTSFITWLSEKV